MSGQVMHTSLPVYSQETDSLGQVVKNYDALGGSRQTGILRPQTEDPDAGKDVPAEAIPARADEPEDPAERPLTKAILDEWMRRWV